MRRALGRTRKGLIAALDVGSSKVCCFIAEVLGDGQPRVLGIGQQASRGLRNGNMVDMEACQNAILAAVHAAEQMAGETIDRVIVSLSGGHPASSAIGVEVSIAGHEVGEATSIARSTTAAASTTTRPKPTATASSAGF